MTYSEYGNPLQDRIHILFNQGRDMLVDVFKAAQMGDPSEIDDWNLATAIAHRELHINNGWVWQEPHNPAYGACGRLGHPDGPHMCTVDGRPYPSSSFGDCVYCPRGHKIIDFNSDGSCPACPGPHPVTDDSLHCNICGVDYPEKHKPHNASSGVAEAPNCTLIRETEDRETCYDLRCPRCFGPTSNPQQQIIDALGRIEVILNDIGNVLINIERNSGASA